jgi:tetratricopeptide (TPR) repeat protein
VREPPYRVLAETGPSAAADAARELRAFGSLLARSLPALGIAPRPLPPTRVLVLRPRSFDELAPYERRGTLGGYARSNAQDATLVVRADASPFVLRHEATHVVLNVHLAAQPLWVAEGLCDLLATADVTEAGSAVGGAITDHLQLLRTSRRPPVEALIDAGQSAALYAPGEPQRLFGAAAWLLVHRLVVGEPDGPARLHAYLAAVAAGSERAEAFTRAFGLTPAAADAALDVWVARNDMPPLAVVPADAPVAPPEPALAEPGEADLALGQLLLDLDRTAEASRRLQRAVQRAPLSAAAHEALAEARLRERRPDLARRHVDVARAIDPARSSGLVRLAQLRQQQAWASEEGETEAVDREVLALAEAALRLAPDDPDAIELRARLNPHPLGVRIAELSEVLRRDPDRDQLGITLAGLHVRRYALGAAAAVLRQVRERTRDDALRFISNHMLTRIAEARAGTVEASGRLTEVGCPKDGALRFTFKPAQGPLVVLLAGGGSSFLMFDAQGEAGERSFTCGPQDQAVEVWYRPLSEGTGVLLALRLA